jgi:putative sterol carrier protein
MRLYVIGSQTHRLISSGFVLKDADGRALQRADEDWVAMSNKTLNVSWAYLTGRLQIQGSHRLVKELDKIFP